MPSKQLNPKLCQDKSTKLYNCNANIYFNQKMPSKQLNPKLCQDKSTKLYNYNANTYFNQKCLRNNLTPNFAKIKVPNYTIAMLIYISIKNAFETT